MAKPEPKNKKAEPANASAGRFWLYAALLFAAAVAVYVPAMSGGYIWDDNALVTENAAVKAANGLIAIWFKPPPVEYLPLTSTSFWLEWRMWGADPAGYHVVNILLHALNAVLLWRVLSALKIPWAWFAALVFAWHPVCAASVAWVAERKNTLSMVFYLWSLLLYLRADGKCKDPPRFAALIPSIIVFALGLLAKPAVAVLPVVLLLCAWWNRGRITRRDVAQTVPYFALAFVLSVVTIWFQHRLISSGAAAANDPLMVRLIAGSWAVWFYAAKALAPIGLTMIYPRWEIDPSSPVSYVPKILLAVLFVIMWRERDGWARPWLFAFGYFVVALAPVLGIFNMAYFSISRVSDHLQYLALPGIIALVVGVVGSVLRQPAARRAVGVVAASGLAVLTWQHEQIFARPESLWKDNAVKNPKSWRVRNSLGACYFNDGDIAAAVEQYKAGLDASPKSADLHFNLANAYYQRGKLDAAAAEYREAVQDGDDNFDAHSNLGVVLLKNSKPEEAIAEFNEVIRLKPEYSEAYRNLGDACLAAGRVEEAIAAFKHALAINPGNAAAQNNLGAALDRAGNSSETIAHFEEQVKDEPGNAAAHRNLALVLAKNGHVDEAISQYEETLKLTPDDATVRIGLGALLDKKGKLDDALIQFQAAAKVDPTNATARKNIGLVLARKGRLDEAITQFQESLKIKANDGDTRNELGNVLGRAGRTAEAKTQFEEALKLDPTIAGAQNGLGAVLDHEGHLDEAIVHFREAVRLKPDLARAHFNLASALSRKGRRAEAIGEYQTVLKLRPNYPGAEQELRELSK